MKINQRMQITGMKSSKGSFEGTDFDSTKVYAVTELDESKGTAKGSASVEYAFGKSDEFEKYKHLPFPFQADCELEFVTNGRVQKMTLVSVKPVAVVKAP